MRFLKVFLYLSRHLFRQSYINCFLKSG